jgi:hypothetical protein
MLLFADDLINGLRFGRYGQMRHFGASYEDDRLPPTTGPAGRPGWFPGGVTVGPAGQKSGRDKFTPPSQPTAGVSRSGQLRNPSKDS